MTSQASVSSQAPGDAPADPTRRALVVGALGVVYGDIGTSPIYMLRECLKAAGGGTDAETVLGLLSLVFWALMIVVTIKYVLFVMRADNDGEGGIMALLGLAAHSETDPRRRTALVMVMVGIAGAALFYGDGIITPAISVLSAIEGMEIAAPFLKPYVVPITIAVLIGLFLVQSRGSERIGAYFGPVMAAWFAVLAAAGLAQVVQNPGVLAALSPFHAVRFLFSHGSVSFLALGSVFLAMTGAEALYADMGHFGRGPIRLDWFSFVLPALALNYFGQGALVLAHPDATDLPFFKLFPGWALVPAVALATAATVIASQAMICGAFSLTQQTIQLGLLPRLDIRQTSEKAVGQVYVPQINWLLMACVIGLVLAFGSSDHLAAAYGIAVAGTMVITTGLMALVARRVWRWSVPVTAAVLGSFLLVDLAFSSASAVKIPQGGWFPLLIGAVVFALMSTWRRGRQVLLARNSEENLPLDQFLARIDPALPRVKGTAVYLAARRATAPYSLTDNLKHNKVLHERIALLTVITERVPFVGGDQRMTAEPLDKGFTAITLRFGFAEAPDVPAALDAHRGEFPADIPETSFLLARETPVPTIHPELSRWRERLYAFVTRNAVSASSYFQIPPKRVVELGTQVGL